MKWISTANFTWYNKLHDDMFCAANFLFHAAFSYKYPCSAVTRKVCYFLQPLVLNFPWDFSPCSQPRELNIHRYCRSVSAFHVSVQHVWEKQWFLPYWREGTESLIYRMFSTTGLSHCFWYNESKNATCKLLCLIIFRVSLP